MIFYRYLLPLLMAKHRAAASSLSSQPFLTKEISQEPGQRRLDHVCDGFTNYDSCTTSPPGCAWNPYAAGTTEDPKCVHPCLGCACIYTQGSCDAVAECVWQLSSNLCTVMPTMSPTSSARPSASASPSFQPSNQPSFEPTLTTGPSFQPSGEPSFNPTVSDEPSSQPSSQPSFNPTVSDEPSSQPSSIPSEKPSDQPSLNPSLAPSLAPSQNPSLAPSVSVAPSASAAPSMSPDCNTPTKSPTKGPTPKIVTAAPTPAPTPSPTKSPTKSPDCGPPTKSPTKGPTPKVVTPAPTPAPTPSPSKSPDCGPPTKSPTKGPTPKVVTPAPTPAPTPSPTKSPDCGPPTKSPTVKPTSLPTNYPTPSPTNYPTPLPTNYPTSLPTQLPTLTPTLAPVTIRGTMFLDSNQNGLQDLGELGLQNVIVALWCRSGDTLAVKVTDTKTDMYGHYLFDGVHPQRTCFVRVESDGYVYGPIVMGGNQLGRDGRSPEKYLEAGELCDRWIGGLFFPFDDLCDGQCEVEVKECGHGIWNKCTCQCDCAPGVCLSSNQQCYDGCTTHLDFNPWGGCRPGVDCPWYPAKLGEAHCESSANFAGIYNLHETAEICCKDHFQGASLSACVQNSIADVQAEEALVQERLDRPRFYWPDQYGKKNCVFDSGYDDWMVGALQASYLFSTPEQCCGKWYPGRSDCPNLEATTPLQLAYKPDFSEQFYYPHLAKSNCRKGRNYPMWMKGSPKHYLYTTPEQCCSVWYPASSGCPMLKDDGVQEEDDGVQEGFYWQAEKAYYPNFKGDFCAVGDSYPEWMADPMNRDTHIFQTAAECCQHWFPASPTQCQNGIVTVMHGQQISGPNVSGTWFPSMDGTYTCIDGTPPNWMTATGTSDYYVFDSHSECCKAHGCNTGSA